MEETSVVKDDIAAQVVPGFVSVNISSGRKYLTQRDNKTKPFATCNTTSMIMALLYSGKTLPSKKEDEQYEDILTNFLLSDPRVAEYYSKVDSVNYAKWKASPDSTKVIPPNEYHAVLSYGTNLWLGYQATKFITSASLQFIIYSLLKGRAVVSSGLWSGFHHITCLVGFETFQKDILSVQAPTDIDLTKISNIIIDDPFGNYKTKYQDVNGNDILVPYSDFLAFTREYNSTTKWAHMILPS